MEIKISTTEKIGSTSALKVFLLKSSGENLVSWFDASDRAVAHLQERKSDIHLISVKINGSVTVVTREEAKTNNLREVNLYHVGPVTLLNGHWVEAKVELVEHLEQQKVIKVKFSTAPEREYLIEYYIDDDGFKRLVNDKLDDTFNDEYQYESYEKLREILDNLQ